MPARTLPGLGLQGGWSSGEDGWDTDMNANLQKLSAYTQLTVLDQDLTAPPGSPTNGDIYIVGQSATGGWAGQSGKIGMYDDGAWVFLDAQNGLVAYVVDEQLFYKYDSGWSLFASPVTFQAYINYDFYTAADDWIIVPTNNTVHNDQAAHNAANGRFVAPVDGYYDLCFRYVYGVNGGSPTSIRAGLGINGADPTDQNQNRFGKATMVDGESSVLVQSTMKLSATDYVNGFAYMVGSDGYVKADLNSFTGHKV